MCFTLHIKQDNAAFCNEDGDHQPEAETARLLREAADRVEEGHRAAGLYDINGNAVGAYTF